MEIPIKMDDLGVPPFSETPKNWPLKLNNLGQLVTGLPSWPTKEKKKQGFGDGNPECKLKTCKSKNRCISKVFVQSLLISYLCLVNLMNQPQILVTSSQGKVCFMSNADM